ncbi:mucin-2-like isoform X1 [Branchiostoma floridae]|uniref:Mucin-2-like isoform X1 n=1 Tax=Branchiostoma floridae TaxID=7739 RepID=A0A9J7MMQ3_BRAFL|nr:mucin-2-like isoform X1 [Branchiostoma floridae]XP_035672830.1 mucin-2-like isoform X1 [Branchiostoma floridae]
MVRLHGRTPNKRDHEAEKPLLPLAIGELKDEPTGRVTLQPDHDFAHSDTREKARKIPGIKVLDTGKDNSCRLKATILFLVALAFAATATCLVVWRVYYNGDQCPPGQLRKGNRCFFSIHRTPGAYYPRPSPEHSSGAKNNVNNNNAEKGQPSHRHIRPEGRHPDEVRNRLEAVATLHPPSPDHHKIPVLKTEHWYPKPFYHVETGFFPPEWLKPRPTKHAPTTSTHDNPPKVIQKPTEVPRTRRPFSGIWKALGLTTEQSVVPTPTQPATSTKQQQTTTVKVTTEKPKTTRLPTSAPSTAPGPVTLKNTTPLSTTKMVQTATTQSPPPTTKAPIVTTTVPHQPTPTTKIEKTLQAVTTYKPSETMKPVIATTRKPASTTTMFVQETITNKAESEATTPKLGQDKVTTASQSSLVTPTTALPPVMSTATSQVPVSSTLARKTSGPRDAKTRGIIVTTVSPAKMKTTMETSTITPKTEVITKHTISPSIRGTTAPATHIPTGTADITTKVNQMQGDQPILNNHMKVTPAATQKQTVTPTAVNVLPSPTAKIPTESAVPTSSVEKATTTPPKRTVPDQKTYQTVPMVRIIQEAADVTSAPDMKTSTRQVPTMGSNKTEARKHAPVIQPEVAKPTSVSTTLAPHPPHLSTRPSIEFVATPTAYRTPWHAFTSDDTTGANENVSSVTAVQGDVTALETATVTSSTPIEFFTATESMTPNVSPKETKQSTLASVTKSTADQEK